MQVTTISKMTLISTLWRRAIFEAVRAGLILGGLLYGGAIHPFFMTVNQGFNNFLGQAILGLVLALSLGVLIIFLIGAVGGLAVALTTTLFFYPLRNEQHHRITTGLIGLIISIIGMTGCLMAFGNLPYHFYNVVSWNGSEIALIVLAGLSSCWATHRFTQWYKQKTCDRWSWTPGINPCER